MSASLIGHESQAAFPLCFSVLLVSSPRGSHFFTQAISAVAALQALVGVGWRAWLLGALDRGAGDILGFIQTIVHAADDPCGDRRQLWRLMLYEGD
jgi:hypothetical protein